MFRYITGSKNVIFESIESATSTIFLHCDGVGSWYMQCSECEVVGYVESRRMERSVKGVGI